MLRAGTTAGGPSGTGNSGENPGKGSAGNSGGGSGGDPGKGPGKGPNKDSNVNTNNKRKIKEKKERKEKERWWQRKERMEREKIQRREERERKKGKTTEFDAIQRKKKELNDSDFIISQQNAFKRNQYEKFKNMTEIERETTRQRQEYLEKWKEGEEERLLREDELANSLERGVASASSALLTNSHALGKNGKDTTKPVNKAWDFKKILEDKPGEGSYQGSREDIAASSSTARGGRVPLPDTPVAASTSGGVPIPDWRVGVSFSSRTPLPDRPLTSSNDVIVISDDEEEIDLYGSD
jgi:hypothetical protein